MSLQDDQTRWGRIGRRAAELCYAAGCPADNICVGYCAAVCPEPKYLIAASDEVFEAYCKEVGRA